MIKWRYYRAPDGALMYPFVPHESGELFLKQILAMPKEGKTPLNYDEAQWMFGKESLAFSTSILSGLNAWKKYPKIKQQEIKMCQDFIANMVIWLSERGYYIQLQGDEYGNLAKI